MRPPTNPADFPHVDGPPEPIGRAPRGARNRPKLCPRRASLRPSCPPNPPIGWRRPRSEHRRARAKGDRAGARRLPFRQVSSEIRPSCRAAGRPVRQLSFPRADSTSRHPRRTALCSAGAASAAGFGEAGVNHWEIIPAGVESKGVARRFVAVDQLDCGATRPRRSVPIVAAPVPVVLAAKAPINADHPRPGPYEGHVGHRHGAGDQPIRNQTESDVGRQGRRDHAERDGPEISCSNPPHTRILVVTASNGRGDVGLPTPAKTGVQVRFSARAREPPHALPRRRL